MKRKRVIIISDLHCGHRAGLTPPAWQYKPPYPSKDHQKFAEVQRTVWNFFDKTLRQIGPVHALIVNGDAIDGRSDSNLKELLEPSRDSQVAMAVDCINHVQAKRTRLVQGTPFHTGKLEHWENQIADKIGAPKPKPRYWATIYGQEIDVRHKVSRSIIPHGRYTPLARARVWDAYWAEREKRPTVNIFVRSHVHYCVQCWEPGHMMFTTPALQAYSEYGVRECEGVIDIGLICLDIFSDGSYKWEPILLGATLLKSDPEKL